MSAKNIFDGAGTSNKYSLFAKPFLCFLILLMIFIITPVNADANAILGTWVRDDSHEQTWNYYSDGSFKDIHVFSNGGSSTYDWGTWEYVGNNRYVMHLTTFTHTVVVTGNSLTMLADSSSSNSVTFSKGNFPIATTFATPYPTTYRTPYPTTYPTPYPTIYPTPYPTTYPTPYPTPYRTSYPTPYPTTYPTTYLTANPIQTSSYSGSSSSSSSGSGNSDSAILIIGIIVIIGLVGLIGFKLVKRDSPSPPTEQLHKTPAFESPERTSLVESGTEDTLNKIQPHIDRLVQNQPNPLESIDKFYSFLELEGFTLTPELKNAIVNKIRETRDVKERDTKKQQISSELFEKKEPAPVKETITPSPQSPVSPFTPRPVTPKQLPHELSDRYTESEFIGKGGFARVFKAKRKDGKYVAVKIPISLDASTGKSFIAEMQNWTKLEHSNIVRVYDYNIMPMPYFEMELCDGSLAEMKKPVDCEEAAWIIFNVCEGLKFTHSRSIIHRDLKPQNILLKNGIPKISDWGLSKVVSESTSTTAISFTPYYAAPEQINSKHKDERTDIWQLGVILYELCTGVLPFRGDSVVEIAVNIATKDPQRPSEIIPNAQPIESVIMKCLEKDPSKRYQTVLELQKDLAIYLRKNYTELLKTSVTVQDYNQSAYYCGDLVMINLLTGDIPTAYKYLLDLVHYSKGDVKTEARELSEQIKMRMELGVPEIPDELIRKAEIIVHQVSMGFGNKG